MPVAVAQPRVSLKKIALPASHGGWGFVLEPILLGLWVAPSAAGAWLGLAALAAFLSQQPLKLAISDWYRGRRYPRSVWAERFALLYGMIALIAFGLAIFGSDHHFWLPLVWAIPLALVQLYFDARNQGRSLIAELCGASALGATASAIALAGGWSLAPALALWAILLARTIVSIVYVRAKLRLERGLPIDPKPVWLLHSIGLLFVAGLAYIDIAPWPAILALLTLLIRAVAGLLPQRKPVAARTVGFQEMGYGLLTIALTALGYIFSF